MRKVIALCLVAATLGGCAQMEQRKRNQQMAAAKVENYAACMGAYTDAAIQPLAGKIPFGDDAPNMLQLSDTSEPTQPQRAALAAWDSVWSGCYNHTGNYLSTYSAAGVSNSYELMLQQERVVRASLYDSKITFGAYNKWRSDELSWFRSTSQQAVYAANAEQQRRNEEAARIRAQNGAAMLGYLAAHPIYTPPVRTSCNYFGNTVNCTTQ